MKEYRVNEKMFKTIQNMAAGSIDANDYPIGVFCVNKAVKMSIQLTNESWTGCQLVTEIRSDSQTLENYPEFLMKKDVMVRNYGEYVEICVYHVGEDDQLHLVVFFRISPDPEVD